MHAQMRTRMDSKAPADTIVPTAGHDANPAAKTGQIQFALLFTHRLIVLLVR